MKRIVLIILSILIIASSTLLFFNYSNYKNNLNSINKMKKDISSEEDLNVSLTARVTELEKEYENLVSEKKDEIEDYEEWEEINKQVKEYLS